MAENTREQSEEREETTYPVKCDECGWTGEASCSEADWAAMDRPDWEPSDITRCDFGACSQCGAELQFDVFFLSRSEAA